MRHAIPLIVSLLLSLAGLQLPAQDYDIHFQTGKVPDSILYHAGALPESGAILDEVIFQGNQYLILQFESIPTATQRQALEAMGVELFGYISHYAYLAKVPAGISPVELGVRAAAVYKAAYKLPQNLADGNYPAHTVENGQLQLMAHPWPSTTPESLRASLQSEGVQAGTPVGGAVPVQIADSLLLELAAHPGILYIAPPEPTPEPEGIAGRSFLRLNLISSGYGDGLDGSGVSMAIGDDGTVHHEDFRGRLTDHTYTDFGDHAEMTAGLAIGAGNIDPAGIGMAPGASLHLYSIGGYPHITNARQYYQQHGTTITSTSYSEGCGGSYTYTAFDIDRQARLQPELLHVFSAGNSAPSACSPTYGGVVAPGGGRYGNITGGRKAAKNVLAVANLFYNGLRVGSSSRGPAEDGRIKPDISAFGQGTFTTGSDNTYQQGSGTSAAAPSVAGAAAVLTQAYRQQHNGAQPPAALLKAHILNTAEDLGPRGPDYSHGWGRLHAGHALEALQQNQHFSGLVSNGGQRTHQLYIPQGIKEARVMLYWTDPEGAPVAAKALVNDLDLSLTTPAGTTHHPWTLSTFPHADSLSRPAAPGTDRVNNAEQIVLDNPASGTYTIRAHGFLLGQGTQPYFITYTFLKDEIAVTYPAGGEHFVPGEPEILRWDAYGNTGSFTLQYSTNSGVSWNTITSNVSGNRRSYSWLTPNLSTGQARIRVLRNGQSGQSSADFTILGVPDFQVAPGAGNTVRVSWAPVAGATQYDVFRLGAYAMEIAGSTANTSITLPAVAGQGNWYSVRARQGTQGAGRRAVAQFYTHFPCEASVTLTLQFDTYPGETYWQITGANGQVAAAGGPYTGQPVGSTVTVQECLSYGCYELTLFDTYQNGMCCDFGNGSYELRDGAGNLLVSGGQFGSSETQSFCLGATAPLQAYMGAVTPVSCSGGQDGSATVYASGGTGIYSYNWSYGATTAAAGNLSAGNYTVTVSDGQNSIQLSAAISSPAPISLSAMVTDATCNGAQDGTALAQASGGAPPFSYRWSHGADTPLATALAPGSYTVTATDQNNCTATRTVEVLLASSIATTLSTTNATCQGAADGEIQASVSGGTAPYSYAWSHGADGPLANRLDPGIYQVTISDDNNCSTIATAVLGARAPLALFVQSENVSCAGDADGWAEARLSGGSGTYTFLWSHGVGEATADSLAPGVYQVEGIDALGCSTTATVEIEAPAPLEIQAATTPSADGNSWSVNLTVSGGTPPYAYYWDNGVTASGADSLAAGDYAITATDAVGCIAATSFTLEAAGAVPCQAQASSSSYEWIESFRFGAFFLNSGNNGGYGNFSTTDSLAINALAGRSYSITLIPGFSGPTFYEYWRLWADFNQDGDFLDPGEELLAPALSSDTIFSNIVLPDSLPPGDYHLRVAIKYGGAPAPCSNIPYGEVEDYRLSIGADTMLAYCNTGGQSSLSEWIEEVSIGRLHNRSGNDGGYSDFTNQAVPAVAGTRVDFTLVQGNSGSPYPQSWRIWADLNQDKDFDDDDELLYSRQGAPGAHSGSFVLPSTSMPGLTRLRVSMKFGALPAPCESFTWGETEDYSLLVLPAQGGRSGQGSGNAAAPNHASITGFTHTPVAFPNPTGGELFIRLHLAESTSAQATLYTATGRLVARRQIWVEAGWQEFPLHAGTLPEGAYYVQLQAGQYNWTAPVWVVR